MSTNVKKIAAVLILWSGLIVGILLIMSHKENPLLSRKLSVVTSFYPLYFFTHEIAGDKAIVSNLTPAGTEPHDYEPSPQDIAKIEESKLLILNGKHLEAWGQKVTDILNGTQVKVVVSGENVGNLQDPHVWLSPPLAKQEVVNILRGLIAVDPDNATYYQQNAKQLKLQLDELDSLYKNSLSSCQNKGIVTSHAAFGYIASTYGLKQVSIAGLSPDEEPSPQQLGAIAQFAKENNVKVIFFEKLVSPKLAQTLAQEVGAKTMVLDPLEGLSEQDMKQGKNYFTIMKENLKNLQTALQCT